VQALLSSKASMLQEYFSLVVEDGCRRVRETKLLVRLAPVPTGLRMLGPS
jgi:hypothetical protein